jgi:hypothetical protein
MDTELEKIREQILNELKRDPFDPASWVLIEKRIPKEFWSLLVDRSGAAKFIKEFPNIFNADRFGTDIEAQTCWERVGNFYKIQGRFHEAISIYFSLYNQCLVAQEKTGTRVHKGTPLVWISDCYSVLQFPVLAKRYLMLTLCEDAIRESGSVSPNTTGVYFRLLWGSGLPDSELQRYAEEIYKLSQSNPEDNMYPEWIIQELDQNWMTEFPSPQEAAVYIANPLYVKYMISKLGDGSGKNLERLAGYILSCMPGCRTTLRQRSKSTDYDIVCSMEGFEVDFRSEMGRYFICECKDWDEPADFTSMAKFCRVLDSTKSRFGILFSKKGISGAEKTLDAEREQLKVFQDRGMVIVVIDQNDLDFVSEGGNLINLLRHKYEKIRLDLRKENSS